MLIGRLGWRERVSGIEYVVAIFEERAASIFVRAGLGEDLDASVAQLVVLGGERVLVDAHFANRFLGRKPPAGEAVDINLPAVGTRAGAGQGLQIGSQIVGIVGENVE